MNSRIPTVRTLCSSLLLVLPLITQAAPSMDFPHAGAGGPPFQEGNALPFASDRLPPYVHDLDLSNSQRARIAEILKTQGASLRDKAEAGRKAQNELRKLAFSSDYSEDKAKALADVSIPIMAELAVLHARLDHAIFTVLTPEQQQQAKEHMANFKGHFPRH
ncbi:Spy/CpxP family protein refolding chaperone [Methylomicrobium sp. Wu6]|uniref:Spy/CpxP family protein refolding chaperone n=1 Tax=Methylomicrobium sp. Wu6 TaxID=3107928 RepID=UPI002DD630AC|nr:Spy/CpxP family protein refolding chaperone [Methylomicrobium sp. Wu6]MEC4749029.1 Spy/CpxP family protein refolding chaperone [Methylomicrobium sp. Wu6]